MPNKWRSLSFSFSLSAILHALLLVLVFANFPASGLPNDKPKKKEILVAVVSLQKLEPKIVELEQKIERKIEPEFSPQNLREIPPAKKEILPQPQQQKTPPKIPTENKKVSPTKPSVPRDAAINKPTENKPAESVAPQPKPAAAPAAIPARATGIASLANVKLLSRVKPAYPQIARKRNEEGTVVLLARVDAGRVVGVSVEKSSGVKTLDSSASLAVGAWKFSSDTNATVRIPVSFSLKE